MVDRCAYICIARAAQRGRRHSPGANAWLLQKEEAAVLMADLRRRSDYREHSSQHLLVNNGQAWRLEGHVGRTAMDLLESRQIALGETGHTDYYGNYIPSRYEVQPGTKGAAEYARF